MEGLGWRSSALMVVVVVTMIRGTMSTLSAARYTSHAWPRITGRTWWQRSVLRSLFERPYEPIDRPRGERGELIVPFELGMSAGEIAYYLAGGVEVLERYLSERGSEPHHQLSAAFTVPKGGPFSTFLTHHSTAAHDLIDLFMNTRDIEDLLQVAIRVHGHVNEGLYVHALAYTLIHKQERVPPIVEIFPNKFVPKEVLHRAQIEANRAKPNATEPVIIDYGPDFATSHIKPEHRVSYWREDYALNSHHWHWHLVNPVGYNGSIDRKGELFFYMHNQMMARYNSERLSVALVRVQKLENWRKSIPDGYFPKLTINNAGMNWGSRQDDSLMKDIQRPETTSLDVTDLEVWRGRLLDAIHQGYMIDSEGRRVPLTDDPTTGKRGIEIVGDAFEADSLRSPNYQFYGNLHNMGHNVLSFMHDPDGSHKEEMAVMGEVTTAVRDPLFFRWHGFVDYIFQRYKMTQKPYTEDQLKFHGIEVIEVSVYTIHNATGNDSLQTGWSKRQYEASRGLDFGSPVPVLLNLKYLNHRPFRYHILVNNLSGAYRNGTVRIFMAPKYNERTEEMTFADQRLLWVEMDKFTEPLRPGLNDISRDSRDSSVTNPHEFSFKDLENLDDIHAADMEDNVRCECGWPQHLLLPRGRPEGMAFQLFVMITNYDDDQVHQEYNHPEENNHHHCNRGMSLCGGYPGQKYPDARPMGFPFDRLPDPVKKINSVKDLSNAFTNILVHNITITFKDEMILERYY